MGGQLWLLRIFFGVATIHARQLLRFLRQ